MMPHPSNDRYGGRYMKVLNALAIHRLHNDKFYSAAEVARMSLSTSDPSYKKTKAALWAFGDANGLREYCDNCEMENGKPVLRQSETGLVHVLKKGERWPKWTGTTWKSKLGGVEKDLLDNLAKLTWILTARREQIQETIAPKLELAQLNQETPETQLVSINTPNRQRHHSLQHVRVASLLVLCFLVGFQNANHPQPIPAKAKIIQKILTDYEQHPENEPLYRALLLKGMIETKAADQSLFFHALFQLEKVAPPDTPPYPVDRRIPIPDQ